VDTSQSPGRFLGEILVTVSDPVVGFGGSHREVLGGLR
jgi:hypothetical protein